MIYTIKNKTFCEVEMFDQKPPTSLEAALAFWVYNPEKYVPLTAKQRSSSFDLSLRFKTKTYTHVFNFKKV